MLHSVFAAAQSFLIFLYHDDWAFAVLDYLPNRYTFKGVDFDTVEYFDFLYRLYFQWTGRVLSFGMQIGITKLGIDCLRFAEAVSLILIVYLLFLSITKRIIPGVSIIFPVVIFMALPAFILTGGIYWFSAASSYVWGVPFFLTATYITHKNNELSSVSVLLLSVSALFHEQMAVAAITFHVCYFVILAAYFAHRDRSFR